MDEVYVSTDIEADGPIPGPYSMLSIGSAAYSSDGSLVGTFSANLDVLPEANAHPETMAWWRQNPDAWNTCRQNSQPAIEVMKEYFEWVRGLPGNAVFVGYPAAFDFMFVQWYLIRFVGESPFSHSALDIKTFAMALLKTPYKSIRMQQFPQRWNDSVPLSHVAVEDAIRQGAMFCKMLKESLSTGQTG